MKKDNFYIYTAILLMLVLPIISIVVESIVIKNSNLMFLVEKWFVFWAIGVRLFTAGFKQVTNPAFTLENIFNIQSKESQVVVRELGFANICMGFLGIISLFIEQFRLSAAIAGGLYFGLAGLLHVLKKRDNKNETFAMVSDLFIFILMLVFVIEKL